MNYVYRISSYGIKIFNLNLLTFPKMIILKHFKIHLNILKSSFALIAMDRNKNYNKIIYVFCSTYLFYQLNIIGIRNKTITNNNMDFAEETIFIIIIFFKYFNNINVIIVMD